MNSIVYTLKGFARPIELSRFDAFNQGHDKRPVTVKVQPRSITDILAKRCLDLILTLPAIIVLSPVFLIVSLLIKATSKGPVFFVQKRLGIGGKEFNIIKFRTMVTNAEELKARLQAQNEKSGPIFKIKKDPRITGVGRFLRKHSIDELPQLINVIKGDMSLVGPRPPVLSEVVQYQPYQKRRLSALPGLTCIWQVSGRSNVSFEQWVDMDLDYIDNWSLALDIKLILKTLKVVVTSDGAY